MSRVFSVQQQSSVRPLMRGLFHVCTHTVCTLFNAPVGRNAGSDESPRRDVFVGSVTAVLDLYFLPALAHNACMTHTTQHLTSCFITKQALQKKELSSREAVLNGIAWDPEEDVLYLTGTWLAEALTAGLFLRWVGFPGGH